METHFELEQAKIYASLSHACEHIKNYQRTHWARGQCRPCYGEKYKKNNLVEIPKLTKEQKKRKMPDLPLPPPKMVHASTQTETIICGRVFTKDQMIQYIQESVRAAKSKQIPQTIDLSNESFECDTEPEVPEEDVKEPVTHPTPPEPEPVPEPPTSPVPFDLNDSS